MNTYEHISTNNKYQQMWININKYEQIATIKKYQQISTGIDKHEQISTNNKSTNINNYQQLWTNINKYQQIWTNMNKYQQIWTARVGPENVLNEPWPFPSTSGYTLGYTLGILRGILLDHGRDDIGLVAGSGRLLATFVNKYQQITKVNKYQ